MQTETFLLRLLNRVAVLAVLVQFHSEKQSVSVILFD